MVELIINYYNCHYYYISSIRDSYSLYYGSVGFDFIIGLVIVSRLLEVARPLTKQLQSTTFDTVAALEKITLLFTILRRIRDEISDVHEQWYSEAVEIANSVGTVPSKPRIANLQIYRANTPSDSISEYY